MTTKLLWFVLAGFLLGFTVSTLWEWFHFRKERMKLRDRRIRELEDQLRAYEEAAERQAARGSVVVQDAPVAMPPEAPVEEWPAPGYRSPGVFLETENEEPRLSEAQPGENGPGPPRAPRPSAPPDQTEPVSRSTRPLAGARLENVSARRRFDASTPLLARRETLRAEPRPQPREGTQAGQESPAPGEASNGLPAWAEDPALTRRSTDYPDDLSKVKGIGDVYKQRLYAAGIYTWHQIATADVGLLRRATNAYPSSNVEEWPEQARQLAEKYGRTNAVYTGPRPDDLTKIIGIGPVGAQVLYRAGICTYEQLAASSVDELAALFPIAVAGDQPDFNRWIAQAVQLANAKHQR